MGPQNYDKPLLLGIVVSSTFMDEGEKQRYGRGGCVCYAAGTEDD